MFKFLFKTAALVTLAGLALEGVKRLEEADKARQNEPDMPVTPARDTEKPAHESESVEALMPEDKPEEPEKCDPAKEASEAALPDAAQEVDSDTQSL